jgi:hypothetical protein
MPFKNFNIKYKLVSVINLGRKSHNGALNKTMSDAGFCEMINADASEKIPFLVK